MEVLKQHSNIKRHEIPQDITKRKARKISLPFAFLAPTSLLKYISVNLGSLIYPIPNKDAVINYSNYSNIFSARKILGTRYIK